MSLFDELVALMEKMRGPTGCPWDREQTISDFENYLREESEEALTAISNHDYENLREELGDLLWHVIFISQIAGEEGYFTLQDVMEGLKAKIIRRHPHVFAGIEAKTADDVKKIYDKVKEGEVK